MKDAKSAKDAKDASAALALANTAVRHTESILRAIEVSSSSAAALASVVAAELKIHTANDEARILALNTAVAEIGVDVKSLLNSRTLVQGAWKLVIVAGSVLGPIATGLLLWFRH